MVELDDDYDKLKPVGRSKLRAQNVELLDDFDERYSGEKVSRKRLDKENGQLRKKQPSLSSEEDMESDDFDQDIEADEAKEEGDLESDIGDEEESNVEDEEEDIEEEEEEDEGSENDDLGENSALEESEEESEVKGVRTLSIRDKEAEMEKGKAVINQISMGSTQNSRFLRFSNSLYVLFN